MIQTRTKDSSDPFIKLFGSLSRVRVLRLFLFNPKDSFTAKEVSERTRIALQESRRELKLLADARLLRTSKGRARDRFSIDEKFPFLASLQQMLLNAPLRGHDVYDRIRHTGIIKLIVLSGIFTGEFDGGLDVLVVGEKISERRLSSAMRMLDADIGRELHFASFPTSDFMYRLTVSDHFVRDIFDYPHRIVFDKLEIGLK